MPRQLRELQAFPELPRHFRKCRISANACDIHIVPCNMDVITSEILV